LRRIQILKNRSHFTDKCFVANHFLGRLKGLLGVKKLEDGGGLWIPACNSVHMWGMSIALDIVFLKRLDAPGQFRVTSIFSEVKPWKIIPLWDLRSTDVLELSVGFTRQTDLKVGDELHVSTEGDLSTEK
jgi:uncharacterized protein